MECISIFAIKVRIKVKDTIMSIELIQKMGDTLENLKFEFPTLST